MADPYGTVNRNSTSGRQSKKSTRNGNHLGPQHCCRARLLLTKKMSGSSISCRFRTQPTRSAEAAFEEEPRWRRRGSSVDYSAHPTLAILQSPLSYKFLIL